MPACPSVLVAYRARHVLAHERDEGLRVGQRQDVVVDFLRASLAHEGLRSVVLELEPIRIDVVLLQVQRSRDRWRTLSKFEIRQTAIMSQLEPRSIVTY